MLLMHAEGSSLPTNEDLGVLHIGDLDLSRVIQQVHTAVLQVFQDHAFSATHITTVSTLLDTAVPCTMQGLRKALSGTRNPTLARWRVH